MGGVVGLVVVAGTVWGVVVGTVDGVVRFVVPGACAAVVCVLTSPATVDGTVGGLMVGGVEGRVTLGLVVPVCSSVSADDVVESAMVDSTDGNGASVRSLAMRLFEHPHARSPMVTTAHVRSVRRCIAPVLPMRVTCAHQRACGANRARPTGRPFCG